MMKGKMVNRVYISSEKDTKNIKDRKWFKRAKKNIKQTRVDL